VSDGFSGAHLDLMDGRADLPRFGAAIKGPSLSLPYVVTDAAGREVEPVSGYLRDLQLSDASPLTCRSYGYDLLRWFRLLWGPARRSRRSGQPRHASRPRPLGPQTQKEPHDHP
jgi:hypothetical protein